MNPQPEGTHDMKTLKPRLAIVSTTRIRTLDAKPGSTPRIRGRAGVKLRAQSLVAGNYMCVDCGRVSLDNQSDHEIPLEHGGSNDLSNRRVRCVECHKAKTARQRGYRPRVRIGADGYPVDD